MQRESQKRKRSSRSRLAEDSSAFLFEEKFDTWLDVRPLMAWIDELPSGDLTSIPYQRTWSKTLHEESWHMLLHSKVRGDLLKSHTITPCLPALVLHHCLKRPGAVLKAQTTPRKQEIKSIKTISHKYLSIQCAHLLSCLESDAYNFASEGYEVWHEKLEVFPVEIQCLWALTDEWAELIAKYRQLYRKINIKDTILRAKHRCIGRGNVVHLGTLNTTFTLTRDIILMDFDGERFLLNQDSLLELGNKISETFSTLLYSYLQDGTILPNGHYMHVVQFLKYIMFEVSRRCTYERFPENLMKENKGFELMKSIEGLGVAELIRRSDATSGWTNTLLLTTLWNNLRDAGVVKEETFDESHLGNIWAQMVSPQISEVLGLVKLAGHPSIDVERGISELYERTHNVLRVNPETVMRVVGVLNKDLCYRFYRSRKSLPLIDLTDRQLPISVNQLWTSGASILQGQGKVLWNRITQEEWELIKFKKNLEFDPVDNQLPLIKDKSMGVTRSRFYMALLCEDSSDITIGKVEERRALLAFLLEPSFSDKFREYLTRYNDDDEWGKAVLDYLIIKLTPKELELKEGGRMFGASPGVERSRRIVQERNTMQVLDEFVPDQLMTPNELENIKKLFSFRHIHALYPGHTALQVSFDFSKWNNNMRSESIDVPAHIILDSLFGTKLYGKTMKAFENALIYYKDANYARYWEGQLGGIEGLNQATWSYIFLGGIKHALNAVGVLYQVTVKGDDVRAALLIPDRMVVNEGIEAIRDRILNNIRQLCQDMGWQLNPNECFVSLNVICTSKQYQVKNTWLSASAKKIMKAESLSNLLFPTLEDLISNIFSVCHSACSQSTAVLPAYLVATVLSARLLYRELEYGRDHENTILSYLLWPQILGGPGGLPLQTFFVRGENDQLSLSISMLRFALKTTDGSLNTMVKNILSQKITNNPDHHLLIADPYSIPIATPVRPSSLLKAIMRKSLKGWVKNRDIKKLLLKSTERDASDFQTVLLTMRPYIAKVATLLWELSPFYLITEIINKFVSSATIFAFFMSGKTGDQPRNHILHVLETILRASDKRLKYWRNTVRGYRISHGSYLGVDSSIWTNWEVCTTQITHQVREASWGFRIEGITYPSLTDQTRIYLPHDLYTSMANVVTTGFCSYLSVCANRSLNQTEYDSHHYAATPGCNPWLGSSTASRIKLPNLRTEVKSPTLSKLLKLIGLRRSGDYLGHSFQILVDSVIKSLTSFDMRKITYLTPDIGGGHIAHRVEIASYSMTTMPNTRPNIFQLVSMNDELLTSIQQDTQDRTINYAGRHFFAEYAILFPLQSQEKLSPDYPSLWVVTFHGGMVETNTGRSQFTLCEWCQNVVTDELININLSQLPNLEEYHHLTMVGTSEYDLHVLQQAIATHTANKVKRTLHETAMDPLNPVCVAIASKIIVKQLSKEHQDVFLASHHMDFHHIPSGALLDIMSISLGIRSHNMSRLSLNVIRAIPAIHLYYTTLIEVFKWFSQCLLRSNRMQVSEILKLSFTQAHLTPMSSLFKTLADANSLRKLCVGCAQAGVLHQKLMFDHGSSESGHIGFMSFYRAHRFLLTSWLLYERPPEMLKLCMHFEDDTTIMEYLNDQYELVLRNLIFRLKKQARCGHLTDIFLKRANNVYGRHEQILSAYTRGERMFLAINVMRGASDVENEDVLHRAILNICGILLVDMMFQKTDWCEIDEFFPQDTTTMTMEFNIAEMTEADYVTDWLDVRESQSLLFGKQFVLTYWGEDILDTCCDYLNYCLRDTDLLQSTNIKLEEVYRIITTGIEWFNRREVSVMTSEDAERVIKAQGSSMDAQLEALIEEEEDLYMADDDITQAHLEIVERIREMGCRKRHARGHQVEGRDRGFYRMTEETLDQIQLHIGANLPSNTDRTHPVSCRMSISHMFKIYGVLNKSISEWIHHAIDCNLLWMLDQHDFPHLVTIIGDGGGAITKQLLVRNKMTYVNMVTLMNIKSDDGNSLQLDAPGPNVPYELMDPDLSYSLVKRCNYTDFYPGDINSSDVRESLRRSYMQSSAPVICVISDAEGPLVHVGDRYLQMLWSITQAVLDTMNINIFGLIKFTCVNHIGVMHWLYNQYAIFEHVHLVNVRSKHPEMPIMYLFFQRISIPINQMDITVHLSKMETSARIHAEIFRQITDETRDYSESYWMFKKYGIVTKIGTSALVDLPLRYHVALTPLNHILTDIKINLPSVAIHFCDWADILLNNLRPDAISNIQLLTHSLAPQQRGAMTLVTGKQVKVAKGVSSVIAMIERIIILICLVKYLYRREDIYNIDVINLYHECLYESIQQLHGCIPRQQNQVYFGSYFGNVLLCIKNQAVVVNSIVATACKICIRLCSWGRCIIRNYSHIRENINMRNLGVSDLGIELRECCRDECEQLSRNQIELMPQQVATTTCVDQMGVPIAWADIARHRDKTEYDRMKELFPPEAGELDLLPIEQRTQLRLKKLPHNIETRTIIDQIQMVDVTIFVPPRTNLYGVAQPEPNDDDGEENAIDWADEY